MLDVAHTTPLSVMLLPPVVSVFPPLLALFCEIELIELVTTEGKPAAVVALEVGADVK